MIRFHGSQLHISMEYDIPAPQIWEIITDTEQWPVWGPSLSRVQSSDRFIRAGSTGRVRTSFGLWLPFTITTFEQLEFWGWQIGRFDATGHQLESLQPSRCRLTFLMPWWAAPYLLICFIALRRIEKISSALSKQQDSSI